MPPPFTDDELVVLLDHHRRRAAGERVDGQALSERLRALATTRGLPVDEAFRTPDGVLRALRRFDVYARGGRDRDSPHYRAVWERYAGDPDALAAALERIEAIPSRGDPPRGNGIESWWSELPDERFWLEASHRTDRGADLHAPIPATRRAHAPAGRPYRPADIAATVAERDPFPIDPAIVERGLRSHALLQNDLADAVHAAGFEPESPNGSTLFDLAWREDEVLWVAEVKSLTRTNEERQLRLGLGQVLRYRQLLAGHAREVRAMLYVERRPRDAAWIDVCASVDVVLRWPVRDGAAE